jgi:hypothetical protein
MPSPFSPSDAALAIFPFTKRDQNYVLRFAAISAVVVFVTTAIGALTGVNADLNRIVEAQATIQGNNDAAIALFSSLNWPGILFLSLVQIVFGTVLLGSALRKTVFSQETKFWGLALGPDEIRLALAQLTALGVFILAYALIVIGVLLLVTIASVVTSVLPSGGLGGAISGLLGVLVVVAAVCVILAVLVRLSLFGVVTHAEQKISVRSWIAQTQGAFWELMGAFLLWGLIAIVLSLVGSAVFGLIAGFMGGSATVQPTSLGALFQPGTLVSLVLKGALTGFVTLGSVCVGAFAWHQMQANATKTMDS